MVLLWITLFLLHQGYALISVTTVQLGEPVTFTCLYPNSENSNTRVKWYKQRVGDNPRLVTTLTKGTTIPTFEQGFSPTRYCAKHNSSQSTLTILRTIRADEAVHYCAVSTWSKDEWSGTYLFFKENIQKTYDIVQWPTASGPVHPGDSVTLQCSVLSDAENETCPSEASVHWFGVRSNIFLPSVIYTDGNTPQSCDHRSDTVKTCVYRLSKNVTSSDAGTYYCAVAACGEIIFGNGTKLDIEGAILSSATIGNITLLLLCAVLAMTVIAAAFFIYAVKNKCECCMAAASFQERSEQRRFKISKDTQIYSAAVFTLMKQDTGGVRGPKAVNRERIYAAFKAFGLKS
ncbi:immunoglobulin kappa light chain-like isoform X1 [Channa argus]